MKRRRILLVDDEVAVLLTLKAVLEISGYEVETAASAKDAKLKLKKGEFAMIITDMRMESDAAGAEVIKAARAAAYQPAIALLTAFPIDDDDWQEMGTDSVEVLMKPMHTKLLLREIEQLLASHESKRTVPEELVPVSAATDRTAPVPGANGAAKKNAGAKKTGAKVSAAKTSSRSVQEAAAKGKR